MQNFPHHHALIQKKRDGRLWHCDHCKLIYSGCWDTIDPINERRSGSSQLKRDGYGRLSSSSTSWTAIHGQGSWYQCDLGQISRIHGVITRGSHDKDEWVTKLSIHVSCDGVSWIQRTQKPRDANFDRNTPIVTLLDDDNDSTMCDELTELSSPEKTKTEWFVKKSFDSFAGKDAHVVNRVSRSGGVGAMRKLALKRGYGGFVLVNDKAYFRSFTAPELIAAAKRVKNKSLELHVCEVVGRIPSSHRKMIKQGHARFVRVYIHSWHKKASLRMGIVVTPSRNIKDPFRCAEGCDFDLCYRCAEFFRLRAEANREIPSYLLSDYNKSVADALVDFSILASFSSKSDLVKTISTDHEAKRITTTMKNLVKSYDENSLRSVLSLSFSKPTSISALDVIKSLSKSITNTSQSFLSRMEYLLYHASLSLHTKDGLNRKAALLAPFETLAREGRTILQLRSLRQVSDDTCGYYALYNASCMLRCLNAKNDVSMLAIIFEMYDHDKFLKWKKNHQSAVIQACKTYFWNSKNAKAGIVGSNEANYIVTRDPDLSSSSSLVCMSTFADLQLNSVEQVAQIDKMLRKISKSSKSSTHVLVIGAHDHWVTIVLEKTIIRNKISEVRLLLIESENKKSIDTPASNDRKEEIQRVLKLLLDSARGITTVARFCVTHEVRKFIASFHENVKRRKDGSLVARGPDGHSLEHFAAVQGGAQSLRRLRSTWHVFRSISSKDEVSSKEEVLIENSVKIEFVKLLREMLRCVSHVGAPSFGRSMSRQGSNNRSLPSLRCPSDGILWIEKYVLEVKSCLKSFQVLSKEDEEMISKLDFGPKMYPIERARKIQPEFVGVTVQDILELLVAFEGSYTDDEVSAELRRELSLRPRCAKGHALRVAKRNGNFCDICNTNGKRKNDRGTSHRCSRGCDFDACDKCWNLHGRGSVVRCVLRSLRQEISRETDAVYPSVRHSLNFRFSASESTGNANKKDKDNTTKIESSAKQLKNIFPQLSLEACVDAVRSTKDLNAAIEKLLKA